MQDISAHGLYPKTFYIGTITLNVDLKKAHFNQATVYIIEPIPGVKVLIVPAQGLRYQLECIYSDMHQKHKYIVCNQEDLRMPLYWYSYRNVFVPLSQYSLKPLRSSPPVILFSLILVLFILSPPLSFQSYMGVTRNKLDGFFPILILQVPTT